MILRHRAETHPPKGRSGGRDRCERTGRCLAISTPSKRINCVIVSLNEPELSGSRHCLCAGVRVELAVEVVDVGLDGPHADEELGGDPAVTLAGCYELKHFELPLAEGFGKFGGRPSCARSVSLQCSQEFPEVVCRDAAHRIRSS